MNIIDLFAGCGGLSLGFEMAGYNVVLAIEKDEWAAETYKYNHKKTHVITKDITEIENPQKLFDKDIKIDGIIGGPPCQGFSLSGNRDKSDPRNSLFMDFIRFVKIFRPRFIVMENVPGILSMKTQKNEYVKDLILNEFKQAGYNVKIHKLNAAEFGVPQARVRILFIGTRADMPYDEHLLTPQPFLFGEKQITIEDAIMDLPQIESGQGNEIMEYTVDPTTDYQRWARKNSLLIKNHVAMRHTQRLIERFKRIKCGQSIAHVEESHKQRKRGDATKVSGKVYSQNNMRPHGNKPSPTIPASFQSNFIHPYLNRNFTAREGARLQSFPDTYHFCGKRTTMSWEKSLSQYQQIGNAVPPLLAYSIAKKIAEYFKNI